MWTVCIIWGTIYAINKKKIQDQGHLPCAKTMAHGKETNVYRVPKPRHTANIWTLPCATSTGTRQKRPPRYFPGFLFFFAVGQLWHRQRLCRVPDKWHTANVAFADVWMPCALCHVRHTAKPLLCAYRALPCALAHGKAAVSRSVTRTYSILWLKVAQCFWRTCWFMIMTPSTTSCPFSCEGSDVVTYSISSYC